jgi:hypothetical protein
MINVLREKKSQFSRGGKSSSYRRVNRKPVLTNGICKSVEVKSKKKNTKWLKTYTGWRGKRDVRLTRNAR